MFGYTHVTGKENSGRRIRKLCRAPAGNQIGQPELLLPSFDFAPGQCRFPTQAKIQSQFAVEAKVVLDIDPDESVAVVLEFTRSLSKREIAAIVGKLARKEICQRREAEFRRLKELVEQINLTALNNPTKLKVVFSFYQAHIVAPG
jgi:hypothetical protein